MDHSKPVLDTPDLKIGMSIRNFDKSHSLKRVPTKDRSRAMLGSLKLPLSIQHFETGSLKHVEPVDKSSPLHIYELTRSFSCYHDYNDTPVNEEFKGLEETGDDLTDTEKEMGEINTDIGGIKSVAEKEMAKGKSDTENEMVGIETNIEKETVEVKTDTDNEISGVKSDTQIDRITIDAEKEIGGIETNTEKEIADFKTVNENEIDVTRTDSKDKTIDLVEIHEGPNEGGTNGAEVFEEEEPIHEKVLEGADDTGEAGKTDSDTRKVDNDYDLVEDLIDRETSAEKGTVENEPSQIEVFENIEIVDEFTDGNENDYNEIKTVQEGNSDLKKEVDHLTDELENDKGTTKNDTVDSSKSGVKVCDMNKDIDINILSDNSTFNAGETNPGSQYVQIDNIVDVDVPVDNIVDVDDTSDESEDSENENIDPPVLESKWYCWTNAGNLNFDSHLNKFMLNIV